jgi:5-dehydro-2-deoxygluconokinase
VINRNDPHCRGVVLLGLSSPEAELVASFQVAANVPAVKGFAVGRTIFAEPAERWLRGEIDDEAAVADLARRFGLLVDAWRAAREPPAAASTPERAG